MFKVNFRKILCYGTIISIIFVLDRISKIYILKKIELENTVDIYLTPYLNFYLIWNKGIAFGLLNFEQSQIYNLITGLIVIISIVILFIIIKTKDMRVYFFSFIFGGAISNLFDRLYYSAVPDFIDFHVNNFHWFIFNVADIFISFGVICLILVEIILDKHLKNENK